MIAKPVQPAPASGSAPFHGELEYVHRWQLVAEETAQLLRQHDELMEARMGLVRERARLFRDLASAAHQFVDDVQQNEDQLD